MSEEDKKEVKEVGEEDSDGTEDDGVESETAKILKIQSERIKELEKERDERALADAKKQLGGRAEAGGNVEKKEETPQEKAKLYIKENFEELR